jgi:hypothetical protein
VTIKQANIKQPHVPEKSICAYGPRPYTKTDMFDYGRKCMIAVIAAYRERDANMVAAMESLADIARGD